MQRDSVDQLHYNRGALTGHLNVVKKPNDVRDIERPQQVGLGPETSQEIGVTEQRGSEVLDRHPRSARLVDGRDYPAGCSAPKLPFFGKARHYPRIHLESSLRYAATRRALVNRQPP